MYRVVDNTGKTIAITTRLEDAKALANTQIDKQTYKIKVDKPKQ